MTSASCIGTPFGFTSNITRIYYDLVWAFLCFRRNWKVTARTTLACIYTQEGTIYYTALYLHLRLYTVFRVRSGGFDTLTRETAFQDEGEVRRTTSTCICVFIEQQDVFEINQESSLVRGTTFNALHVTMMSKPFRPKERCVQSCTPVFVGRMCTVHQAESVVPFRPRCVRRSPLSFGGCGQSRLIAE